MGSKLYERGTQTAQLNRIRKVLNSSSTASRRERTNEGGGGTIKKGRSSQVKGNSRSAPAGAGGNLIGGKVMKEVGLLPTEHVNTVELHRFLQGYQGIKG